MTCTYPTMKGVRNLISKPRLAFSFACVVLIPLTMRVLSWNLAKEGRRVSAASSAASVLVRTKSSEKKKPSKDHALPTTDFTPHVNQLLELVDFDGECGGRINLSVSKPFSVPNAIDCPEDNNGVYISWCAALKKIFLENNQILPANISVSFSRGDYSHPIDGKCFASSSVGGEFCMMNFLEMKRMKDKIEYPIIPWENRSSIPVWRGKPWIRRGKDVDNVTGVVEDALSRSPRLKAVAYSFDHPTLLDAKIGILGLTGKHKYWRERETNGMDKLFPEESFIKQEAYYTKYQVALVLGGIGAAFRTSIHLSTETAIVLQEFKFKEWFTPMMKPFEHYIPLREDMSDLDEKMRWIADHPVKVRQIARNGHKFYQRYLSFEKNEAHIAELVYRMAMLRSERESNRTESNQIHLLVVGNGFS